MSHRINEQRVTEIVPCPFCNVFDLQFIRAVGYEMHYRDSFYICRNCGMSIPVGNMPTSEEDLKHLTKFLTRLRRLALKRLRKLLIGLHESYQEYERTRGAIAKANDNIYAELIVERI